jgi:hypothetical protein
MYVKGLDCPAACVPSQELAWDRIMRPGHRHMYGKAKSILTSDTTSGSISEHRVWFMYYILHGQGNHV